MSARDDLAALHNLIHNAVRQDRGLLEGVDIQRIATTAADAIIAAGWRTPDEPHEHEWIDPRDIIAPPEMCAVCHAWRPPDE